MRELKTIKCNGDMIKGDIFENENEDGLWRIQFRIKTMVAEDVSGNKIEKNVRARYSLEDLKEFRDELNSVIEKMEEEHNL